MKLKKITQHTLFRPIVSAALTVLSGLALWGAPFGEAWVNGSYDNLFRFGTHAVTNQVVVIFMDNQAYARFHQVRGQAWDRSLHARLLDRLTADGCSLVAFDTFFRGANDPAKDAALIAALRRASRVVLMAEQADVTHPNLAGAAPVLPDEIFLSAAHTNWGVAWLDPDLDSVVRKQWPFLSPGPYPSLSWTAASLMGVHLNQAPQERWLRYYGPGGAWTSMSYDFALTQPSNYFRGKIVFIGSKPKTTFADGEEDEFRTPYTLWTGETVGGVEILVTALLNLMNEDWLTRANGWVEVLILAIIGIVLGTLISRVRLGTACAIAAVAALGVTVGAVWLSSASHYWFPWMVVAGGQVPLALAWAIVLPRIQAQIQIPAATRPGPADTTNVQPSLSSNQELPIAPDYEIFNPPFAEGAYGKVWLARNAIGQWQALKTVYAAKFGQNIQPYEREFNGIRHYKPLSDKHPGLLRVDFVSRPTGAEYFFYVMELGDALAPGWEQNPLAYKPRDLASVRSQSEGRRLPLAECVRIGVALAEALEFLHEHGLTHGDIKPQNIIFVNGQPKLADVGLVAEVLSSDEQKSSVGTPGYMPPAPEPSGTPQADIYGLGMVLYVIRTGFTPIHFPEVSETLLEGSTQVDFAPLNALILKACEPDCGRRFTSMAEMRGALMDVQSLVARLPHNTEK